MAQETKPTDGAFATLLRWEPHVQHGLTKREYFAAMALQGLLAEGNKHKSNIIAEIAEIAVEAADLIIEELNKTKQP